MTHPHYRSRKISPLVKILGILSIAIFINMTIVLAQAHAKPHKAQPGKSARNKGGSTTQKSPSEETTAERDRRLYRECKGMHNAGACLGYTR